MQTGDGIKTTGNNEYQYFKDLPIVMFIRYLKKRKGGVWKPI